GQCPCGIGHSHRKVAASGAVVAQLTVLVTAPAVCHSPDRNRTGMAAPSAYRCEPLGAPCLGLHRQGAAVVGSVPQLTGLVLPPAVRLFRCGDRAGEPGARVHSCEAGDVGNLGRRLLRLLHLAVAEVALRVVAPTVEGAAAAQTASMAVPD